MVSEKITIRNPIILVNIEFNISVLLQLNHKTNLFYLLHFLLFFESIIFLKYPPKYML